MIEAGFELATGLYLFIVVLTFFGWLFFGLVAGCLHTNPKPENPLPARSRKQPYDPWVTYRCGCVRREHEWFRRCKLHSRSFPNEVLRQS